MMHRHVEVQEGELLMVKQLQQPIEKEIKTLREIVPQLVDQLRLDNDVDITSWQTLIDKKLLPKLSPDFPLVASICGGDHPASPHFSMHSFKTIYLQQVALPVSTADFSYPVTRTAFLTASVLQTFSIPSDFDRSP